MMTKAIGDNKKHMKFIRKADSMKNAEFIITNIIACFDEIIPLGISLLCVLGFLESIFRSAQRLNAIAAFLAVIIQINTRTNNFKSSISKPTARVPIIKPIAANGNANTVWLNLMSDK